MKVQLNWFDTGYRSARPKKKAAKPKKVVARVAPDVAPDVARAAPVVARVARKPKSPAVARVAPDVARAAPVVARVARVRKKDVPAGVRWVKGTYDVVHQSGRLRSVSGEVLLPGRVWGVNLDQDGVPMLTHLPSGALVCRGPSVAAMKKAAASIPDVGPGWGSQEFLKVARAILARKSLKTPQWWGEASDAIRSVCP